MFNNIRIRIDEIIFVNRLFGNEKGSHTKYKTDGVFHYQLLYKLSGYAIITFDAKTVREKADDLRFTPNPLDFGYPPIYTADVLEKGESINIGFTASSPLPKEILVNTYNCAPTLKKLFLKIYKSWHYKHEGYYYRCMALLYDIFAEISKSESTYLPSNLYKQILPAVEYIDHHFTDPDINCDELARLCNISHTYMSKLFNKRFGVSPKKYISLKKLEYACDLINTRQYSINEISEIVGFSNTYYFSRVFKNHFGICPTEYSQKFST